jgi:hypothetical protein
LLCMNHAALPQIVVYIHNYTFPHHVPLPTPNIRIPYYLQVFNSFVKLALNIYLSPFLSLLVNLQGLDSVSTCYFLFVFHFKNELLGSLLFLSTEERIKNRFYINLPIW